MSYNQNTGIYNILKNNFSKQPSQIILGFDFGAKYIGIAIGQTMTNTARPLTCLKVKNQKINWQEIDQLINAWNPGQLIVGIPLDMQGKQQHTTFECLNFLNELEKRYNLPTNKVDERLSTWEAKKSLSISQKNKFSSQELHQINAMTAAILVEQWLNEKYT